MSVNIRPPILYAFRSYAALNVLQYCVYVPLYALQ